MAGQMWFGTLYETKVPGTSSTTVNAKMQWVPCPDTGMGGGAEGYSELLQFENGGADVVSAAATHRVYDMQWGTRSGSGAGGLDIVRSYQQGIYGPGLVYFVDPMATNLFPPNWATPAIIRQGWKNISRETIPTLTNTAANAYNQPLKTAVFDMTNASVPATPALTAASQWAVIPIPSDKSLVFGFTGSATGAGVVQYRGILTNGSYGPITNATMLSPTGATRTNVTLSGATYRGVEIWLGKTSVTAATISITSAHAQLVSAPFAHITGAYVPGAGHTGCKFTSAAIVESYVMTDRTLKGMSTQLTEVGAWQRAGT